MDDRVASAVSNWAPRFTTNGVAVADFQRVTAGVERWEDWCSAWSDGRRRCTRTSAARRWRRAAPARPARTSPGGRLLPLRQVPLRRVPGRDARRRTSARWPASPTRCRTSTRRASGWRSRSRAAAWSACCGRRPEPGPHPVVVMVPGLDSTKEEFRSTEALFLERGLATFSVDGPGQGEAEYDLPIRGDWEVPGQAFVDAVAAQPGIDPEPDRRLGREPRRLLRAAGRQRGRPDQGLRRPGRARTTSASAGTSCPPLTRTAFTARSFSADQEAGPRRPRCSSTLDRRRRATSAYRCWSSPASRTGSSRGSTPSGWSPRPAARPS